MPIHDCIKEKIGFVDYAIPFSTVKKSSLIAIRYPDLDRVRIFAKGAPESLIFKCNMTFNEEGDFIEFDDEHKTDIVDRVIRQEYCQKGLRCLAFAFRDFTIEEFELLREENNNFTTDSDRQSLYQNLTLISIFAMEDKIRPEVSKAVKIAKGGNITVRLVSGDHPDTAIEFAIQARIIKPEERDTAVMTGEVLRQKVGGLRQDGMGKFFLEDPQAFRGLINTNKCKIIARANPEDKQLLAIGL